MSNLIFNNNSIRTNGNLVCLTDMAKPFEGKRLVDWTRLDSTEAYLSALSVEVGIPTSSILVVSHGKPTFGTPEVAIAFAQWLSPEFHVWCIRHLRTLMETGSTQLKPVKPKSLNDILLDEVYAEVDRLAFNSTQALGVKATIPQYLMELNAKDTHTALAGIFMALTRLKLEENKSNPVQLHRTIHKQLRQVQIKIEGVASVDDSLLTGKELKDKTRALEANPSSKQHLLPEIPTLAKKGNIST